VLALAALEASSQTILDLGNRPVAPEKVTHLCAVSFSKSAAVRSDALKKGRIYFQKGDGKIYPSPFFRLQPCVLGKLAQAHGLIPLIDEHAQGNTADSLQPGRRCVTDMSVCSLGHHDYRCPAPNRAAGAVVWKPLTGSNSKQGKRVGHH